MWKYNSVSDKCFHNNFLSSTDHINTNNFVTHNDCDNISSIMKVELCFLSSTLPKSYI